MENKKQILTDSLFTLVTLIVVFLVNLFLVRQFDTKTMTPMVFVLGVFLVFWRTQGYAFGIASSLISVLALLSQHRGKVMTYSALIRGIWGTMDDGSIKKIQVNMANIRKKLGCKPGENRYIVNELGVGYRMLDDQG